MGGKNPVIVTASADLDLAVEGTARSAFGFGGQKCSAASRVFVHASIADEFTSRLVARAAAIPATSPLDPGGFLSPVVDAAALERYDTVIADVAAHGEVLCGGARVSPTGTTPPATTSLPPWCARRTTRWCGPPSCSCR